MRRQFKQCMGAGLKKLISSIYLLIILTTWGRSGLSKDIIITSVCFHQFTVFHNFHACYIYYFLVSQCFCHLFYCRLGCCFMTSIPSNRSRALCSSTWTSRPPSFFICINFFPWFSDCTYIMKVSLFCLFFFSVFRCWSESLFRQLSRVHHSQYLFL